jgi:microtubule-associated protein-like 6
MNGHYTPNQKWTNEAWGLSPFSDGDRFATCSDDGTLRVWSSSQRKMISCVTTNKDKNNKEVPLDMKTKDYQD